MEEQTCLVWSSCVSEQVFAQHCGQVRKECTNKRKEAKRKLERFEGGERKALA